MTHYEVAFRRTERDRQAPREVVTASLLGDPPADLQARRLEAANREDEPLKDTRFNARKLRH
jgi:hypothetical protein